MPRGDKGNGLPYTDQEIQFIKDNAHMGVDWLAHELGRSDKSVTNRAWRCGISTRRGGETTHPRSVARRLENAKKHKYARHGWCLYPKKPSYKMIRKLVMERDKYTCVYCGKPAQEVDHVIPQHLGGHDYPSNLVAACKRCNYIKGTNCAECPSWRKLRGI
jgi:hypothetical protein